MITVTKAIVKDIIEYRNDLREYVIIPEKHRLFKAGMFLQLSLEIVSASDLWPESRTFSIANAYDKNNPFFRIIIRKVAKYTTRIFEELVVGSSCTVKYAFGELALPSDKNIQVICIAGGSGIAPFIGFLEECQKTDRIKNLYIFYSAKTANEVLYKEKLESLLSERFEKYITQEKSNCKYNRRIKLDDILNKTKTMTNPHYYICGAPDFIEYFKNCLKTANQPNILTDEWV